MKTIDILNLWSSYNRVFEDSRLTLEEKAAIGEEVLMQLPYSHLVPSVEASLKAVTRSIRSCIDELEHQSAKQEPEPESPDAQPSRAERNDGSQKRKGTGRVTK